MQFGASRDGLSRRFAAEVHGRHVLGLFRRIEEWIARFEAENACRDVARELAPRRVVLLHATAAGADAIRHFELADDGELRVWARWLEKGDLLMQGRYDRGQNAIEIALEEPGGARVRLRRVSGPRG
jgi:hypothetical protein